VPVGVSYGQDLFPGATASDLLLFESPGPDSPIRLTLPAEAWGSSGVFRFQIPSLMTLPQQGNKPW
jgi:hypothetical protein